MLIEENETGLLIVTFRIGNALFGINANRVQEVVQVKKNTPVHHAPIYIKGVMNLRGKVVTIIDIGQKLAFGEIVSHEDNRILIVEWKQEHIGLLVECIAEVLQMENDSVREPPGNVHGVQSTLIEGVFQNSKGNLIALLDVDRILEIEGHSFDTVNKDKEEMDN